ncbi:hypothetical protein ACJMK2_008586 [Sinanodonta woodiana]|uniref:Uncharacterized protein n=1 Tax=Sinanodonta woodiana TaxID=1069815 RepID=A0ABD3VMC1_SINWO
MPGMRRRSSNFSKLGAFWCNPGSMGVSMLYRVVIVTKPAMIGGNAQKQDNTTNNTKQQTTQNASHTIVQNNETTPKSYAESIKVHIISPGNVTKNLFGKK